MKILSPIIKYLCNKYLKIDFKELVIDFSNNKLHFEDLNIKNYFINIFNIPIKINNGNINSLDITYSLRYFTTNPCYINIDKLKVDNSLNVAKKEEKSEDITIYNFLWGYCLYIMKIFFLLYMFLFHPILGLVIYIFYNKLAKIDFKIKLNVAINEIVFKTRLKINDDSNEFYTKMIKNYPKRKKNDIDNILTQYNSKQIDIDIKFTNFLFLLHNNDNMMAIIKSASIQSYLNNTYKMLDITNDITIEIKNTYDAFYEYDILIPTFNFNINDQFIQLILLLKQMACEILSQWPNQKTSKEINQIAVLKINEANIILFNEDENSDPSQLKLFLKSVNMIKTDFDSFYHNNELTIDSLHFLIDDQELTNQFGINLFFKTPKKNNNSSNLKIEIMPINNSMEIYFKFSMLKLFKNLSNYIVCIQQSNETININDDIKMLIEYNVDFLIRKLTIKTDDLKNNYIICIDTLNVHNLSLKINNIDICNYQNQNMLKMKHFKVDISKEDISIGYKEFSFIYSKEFANNVLQITNMYYNSISSGINKNGNKSILNNSDGDRLKLGKKILSIDMNNKTEISFVNETNSLNYKIIFDHQDTSCNCSDTNYVRYDIINKDFSIAFQDICLKDTQDNCVFIATKINISNANVCINSINFNFMINNLNEIICYLMNDELFCSIFKNKTQKHGISDFNCILNSITFQINGNGFILSLLFECEINLSEKGKAINLREIRSFMKQYQILYNFSFSIDYLNKIFSLSSIKFMIPIDYIYCFKLLFDEIKNLDFLKIKEFMNVFVTNNDEPDNKEIFIDIQSENSLIIIQQNLPFVSFDTKSIKCTKLNNLTNVALTSCLKHYSNGVYNIINDFNVQLKITNFSEFDIKFEKIDISLHSFLFDEISLLTNKNIPRINSSSSPIKKILFINDTECFINFQYMKMNDINYNYCELNGGESMSIDDFDFDSEINIIKPINASFLIKSLFVTLFLEHSLIVSLESRGGIKIVHFALPYVIINNLPLPINVSIDKIDLEIKNSEKRSIPLFIEQILSKTFNVKIQELSHDNSIELNFQKEKEKSVECKLSIPNNDVYIFFVYLSIDPQKLICNIVFSPSIVIINNLTVPAKMKITSKKAINVLNNKLLLKKEKKQPYNKDISIAFEKGSKYDISNIYKDASFTFDIKGFGISEQINLSKSNTCAKIKLTKKERVNYIGIRKENIFDKKITEISLFSPIIVINRTKLDLIINEDKQIYRFKNNQFFYYVKDSDKCDLKFPIAINGKSKKYENKIKFIENIHQLIKLNMINNDNFFCLLSFCVRNNEFKYSSTMVIQPLLIVENKTDEDFIFKVSYKKILCKKGQTSPIYYFDEEMKFDIYIVIYGESDDSDEQLLLENFDIFNQSNLMVLDETKTSAYQLDIVKYDPEFCCCLSYAIDSCENIKKITNLFSIYFEAIDISFVEQKQEIFLFAIRQMLFKQHLEQNIKKYKTTFEMHDIYLIDMYKNAKYKYVLRKKNFGDKSPCFFKIDLEGKYPFEMLSFGNININFEPILLSVDFYFIYDLFCLFSRIINSFKTNENKNNKKKKNFLSNSFTTKTLNISKINFVVIFDSKTKRNSKFDSNFNILFKILLKISSGICYDYTFNSFNQYNIESPIKNYFKSLLLRYFDAILSPCLLIDGLKSLILNPEKKEIKQPEDDNFEKSVENLPRITPLIFPEYTIPLQITDKQQYYKDCENFQQCFGNTNEQIIDFIKVKFSLEKLDRILAIFTNYLVIFKEKSDGNSNKLIEDRYYIQDLYDFQIKIKLNVTVEYELTFHCDTDDKKAIYRIHIYFDNKQELLLVKYYCESILSRCKDFI